jgi:hypothetical protein
VNSAPQEEADRSGWIKRPRYGIRRDECFDLRGKPAARAIISVIERLDAVRVARQDHATAMGVPDREREHPAQLREHPFPFQLPQMQKYLGVRV